MEIDFVNYLLIFNLNVEKAEIYFLKQKLHFFEDFFECKTHWVNVYKPVAYQIALYLK